MASCTALTPPNPLAPGPAYNAALATAVLFPLGILFSVWLFFTKRKSSTRLRKRDPTLLLVSAIGSLGFWACTVLYDSIGGQHYPCALLGLLAYMACPMAGSPVLLKVVKYSSNVALQKLRENKDIDLTPCADARFWFAHFKFTLSARSCSREEHIMNARFARTTSYALLWLGVTNVPFLLAYLLKLALTPAWREGCLGCELDFVDCILLLCLNFVDCAVVFLTVWPHTRSKRDPLRILHECLLAIFVPGIWCNVAIILYMTDPGGAQARGYINYRSLTLLTSVMCVYLQTVHQVYLAGRMKRELLTMDRIGVEDRFQDVRADRDLNLQLQAYLYKELSGETLRFMDAVDAYKHPAPISPVIPFVGTTTTTTPTNAGGNGMQLLPPLLAVATTPAATSEDEALAIYRQFIEPNRAPEEVNLPHSIREPVSRAIASRAYSLTMFDAAYVDIKNSLLKDGFARFLAKVNMEYSTAQANKAAAGSRVTGISLNAITPRSKRAGTQTNDFQLAPSGSSGGGGGGGESAHSPRSSTIQEQV